MRSHFGWEQIWSAAPDTFREKADPDEIAFQLAEILPRSQCILDIGCGMGRNLVYLSQNGHKVVGLDISRTALYTVDAVIRKARLFSYAVQGDFTMLPFRSCLFDAAIAVNVIYHGTKSQIRSVVEQVATILKPGGAFIFNLLSKECWQYHRYLDFVQNHKAYECESGTFVAYPETALFDMHLPHHFMDSDDVNNFLLPYNVESVVEERHLSKYGDAVRWSVHLRF